jgi:hypothetical protein
MPSTDHLNRQMHCRTALFLASPPGRETENVTGLNEEQVAAYGKTVAVGSDVLKGLNALTTAAGVARLLHRLRALMGLRTEGHRCWFTSVHRS